MYIFSLTVFLGAFLLFLVQPLLAKYILPWFGGSPGVWTTCLLFFQVILTIGYAFAHWLVHRYKQRQQAIIIICLLALTLLCLPITPSRNWVPESFSTPIGNILGLLLFSIGACYFLLSANGPLMQSWSGRLRPDVSPYRLYTLSNLGSLLAICSYPFLVEPYLSLSLQAKLWSLSYALFAVFGVVCALRLLKSQIPDTISPSIPTSQAKVVSPSNHWLWLVLPAMGSTMLLATTNQLCMDVAAIPLLWLLPMGIYLLSYILSFHSERWYSRCGFGIALAATLVQSCIVLNEGVFVALPLQIASYSLTLFICCMICHGELVLRKPSSEHLTSFYLRISIGGALGGVFVNLVAPYIFKGYWEYPIGLAGTALLFLIILFQNPKGRLSGGRPAWAWALLYIAFTALLITLATQIHSSLQNSIFTTRNFFGVLKILEEDTANPQEHRRVLLHGRIEHGFQFADKEKSYWPTAYFGPNSGAGIAIRFHPRRLDPAQGGLRIGVIGLGAATLSAYGEAADYFRFYEINPEVLRLSDEYFTYRKHCPSTVDVVLGDARISMEQERRRRQSGQFDILAVDAFSSDAIPIHLLTRECYWIYRYHLKSDGILAIHISSRFFDLSPVIRSLAALDTEHTVDALRIEDDGSHLQGTDPTCWILLTSNKAFLAEKHVRAATTPWEAKDPTPLLFTDDYSNLFHLLKRR